ncbi:autophagy protein 5 [Trichodelitschia bisporula]|uniref:Autophagy protein 5 n=1 Tax=Trichodelitschia bisporula TaxID=703511 RepID=A0A6G1IB98_9PEZI|nr:autophagy protein 5 [Trichodelitschia bisporula]
MAGASTPSALQTQLWAGSIPLAIRLAKQESKTYESDVYLVYFPRISYLPLLHRRLHEFFFSSLIDQNVFPADGWLSYEDVPLKWHYPVGLLFDLYSGASEQLHDQSGVEQDQPDEILPWKLTLHFSDWPTEHLVRLDPDNDALRDAFRNSVKEACFLRHGSGKVIMSLSREDSTKLWLAVEQQNLAMFNSVNQKLLHPPGVSLRYIPLKVYLPAAAAVDSTDQPSPGHLRVVQSLVTPTISTPKGQTQTLGMALNTLLPTLFPSRRSPLLALPVLHGAVVPLSVPVETLAEVAAYADGFLHIAVVMMA